MRSNILFWLSSLLLVAGLWGCTPQSPEDRVLSSRAEYTVQSANALPQRQVTDATMEDVAMDEGENGAEDETAGAAEAELATEESEGEGIAEAIDEEGMMEIPVTSSVLFDVVMTFSGNDPLPGVTLDIVHKDPFDQIKTTRRQYIETPTLTKGQVLQTDFVLEDLSFEEGDTFEVELRGDIPPGERSEYREFAEAGN